MTSALSCAAREAESLTLQVLEIHSQLSPKDLDLRPSEVVNGLFGRLVGLSIKTISEAVTTTVTLQSLARPQISGSDSLQVLSDPRIDDILTSLHERCGTAEGHLESHWANLISGDESSTEKEVQTRLEQFPYYSNYVDLTRMELSALHSLSQASAPPTTRFAFIGSGPLPLTSLCICSSQRNAEVLNIDIQEHAIAESETLCRRLGPVASGMSFKHAAASDPSLDLRDFDVVYLAALVGSTQDVKEDLLVSVVGRMKEGALLVVRSAERLRRLMYAEFDPTTEKVRECLDICLAVHPYNHVVNSVIIGKVKSRKIAEEVLASKL
ncbi:hypothetical protein PZA11_005485 [Diplocarpon coronariae]|uniref:Nicotianamine synthase n=1 Tax=Diplocarpon coronariae TaxID=2795749 RepID=A0A218ZF64_9HELO|nr:nicotianamine synthase [Marssonina coronariae]